MKILGCAAFNVENIVGNNYDNAIGYIVELNGKECLELYRLYRALRGRSVDGSFGTNLENKMLEEIDLSQALKAINEFANIKRLVEQVKESLEELDAVLMSRK